MVYCISYDLRKPGRNYDSLIEYVKGLGPWCHALESTWYVVTNATAEAIRDGAIGHIDANDAILVNGATAPGAWRGLPKDISEWLVANLK